MEPGPGRIDDDQLRRCHRRASKPGFRLGCLKLGVGDPVSPRVALGVTYRYLDLLDSDQVPTVPRQGKTEGSHAAIEIENRIDGGGESVTVAINPSAAALLV